MGNVRKLKTAGTKILSSSSIAEILVSQGMLEPEELEHALSVNHGDTVGLGPLLVRLGLVSDRDLANVFARHLQLPLLEDAHIPETEIEDCALSYKFLLEAKALPVDDDGANLTVAFVEPDNDYLVKAIEMATGRTVTILVASLSQVEKALERLYAEGQSRMSDIADEIIQDHEFASADSIERLRDLAAEAPIIRMVSLIINQAIESRASDIHIEPFEKQLKVRFRIDGVLQEVESPPARSTAAVISRIKIMAKLDIAERRLPQDGRIQLKTQGKEIDLRVSTVPTMHGESLVLRILDKQHLTLDLEVLGFDGKVRENFERCLNLPHGIILVTGPTGSGKTTTLYAALQLLNTPEKKILTVEDPVEYQLEGINQIQVKPRINLNFADALRSIVRQDPDVIMVGEMRDIETARIAVQSALTGHQVFSTVHTNDAGSSITRLMDMGVEDYLLTSTLNGVLAQRLVRKICSNCAESYAPQIELINELGLDDTVAESLVTLLNAKGCEECSNTGYKGRSVITEFMILSDNLRQLILSHADAASLQRQAIKEGMVTMKRDGINKAVRGLTTIEEVTRITQE